MKHLSIFIFLCISLMNASAQINHFIYFQTENKQPFYVKIDNKILSSSPAGYLIVPKLKQGNYKIAFGFPKNETSEKVISYTVDKKDAGYIIKNFGEKGWGLFNLQTFDVIMPGDVVINNTGKPVQQNQNDAFSNMLATVVDDSTIRQNEVTHNASAESFNKTEPVKEENTFVSLNADSSVSTSIIKRALYSMNEDGVELMYTDNSGAQNDTIRIFFSVDKNIIKTESQAEGKNNISKDSVDNAIASQNNKSSSQENEVVSTTKSAMLNSDCKSYASEEDFRKLRKKMTAEDNDDDMMKLAKKAFRSRCFTAGHIKSLSALFLKDDAKYNFFDAAYPFVSDSNNFAALQSELTDSYYITRFKAMIHH